MKNIRSLFTKFVKKIYSGSSQTSGILAGVVIILTGVLLVGIIS